MTTDTIHRAVFSRVDGLWHASTVVAGVRIELKGFSTLQGLHAKLAESVAEALRAVPGELVEISSCPIASDDTIAERVR